MSDDIDYDAAVAASLGQTKAQDARIGFATALDTNPDAYAEDLRIARRTGLPPAQVTVTPQEARKQAALGSVDFATLQKTAPATASLLADVEKAKLAHDDVEGLSRTEAALSFLAGSAKGGFNDLLGAGAKLADAVNPFTLSDADAAVLFKDDPEQLARLRGDSMAMGLSRFARGRTAAAKQNMADISPGAKAIYGDLRYATTDPNQAAYLSPVKMFGDAIRSLPTTVALALTTMLTRGTAMQAERQALAAGATAEAAREAAVAAATGMAVRFGATSEGAIGYAQQALQTQDQVEGMTLDKLGASPEFQRLVEQGYDPNAARIFLGARAGEQAGVGAGFVDALTNAIGGRFLGRIIGDGGALLPRIGKGFATEAGVEFVQSGGEQLLQNMAVRANADPTQGLGDDVLESMLQGLFVGGLTGGTFAGVFGRSAAREQQAQQAEKSAEAIARLNEFAAASKVLQRDPDTFEQFVAEATQDGPLQQVFISADALMQSGVLEQVAELSPAVAEQFELAAETGGQIAIPVEEYTARIAASEYAAALLDHLKTAPEGFSRAEAQHYMENHAEELQAEVERVLTEQQGNDVFKASAEVVRTEIKGQLDTAARFTPQVNDAYASMVGDFYAVTAARIGTTPEALYQQYPLKVVAETVNGQRFEQGAALQQKIDADFPAAVAEYNALPEADHGRILNVDLARELSADYRADRTRSSAVHEPASAFIKRVYAEKLAQPTPDGMQPEVLFTAGGTGAGKSTGLEMLGPTASTSEIVYDTNMNSFESADKKIQQALAAKREVKIIYTYRDPVDALVSGALPRAMRMGRTVPLSEHARTHQGSYEAIPRLLEKYGDHPSVQILVVDNSRGKGNAVLADFANLPIPDYNGIEEKLYAALQSEYAAGRISSTVYRGTAERGSTAAIQDSPGQEREPDHVASGSSRQQGTGSEDRAGNTGQSESQNPDGTVVQPGLADQSQIKSATGDNDNFDPNNPNILHQTVDPSHADKTAPRGFFSPETATIGLLNNADLSTFLHESGHFFLEVMADLAARTDAPAPVRQDMEAVLAWFGVRDLAEWHGFDLEQRRPYHEQFARGFEKYLFEGKAPSIEMQGLFQRFRAWLLNVYKDLRTLNVELNDDVRGVFDRMLASGEQIALAEQGRSMLPLFSSPEQAGMTVEEFAAYQALGVDATNEAIEDLQARGLRDMQWLHNARGREIRRLQQQAKARRAEVEQEVRREVMSQSVYRAWEFLTRKEETADAPAGKLGRSDLEQMYGGAVGGQQDRYALLDWKRLTDLRMTTAEGLHPDLVAEQFGFTSGDELVQALLAAEAPKTAINQLTDRRMLEAHGELVDPEAMARAADTAIHNDLRARVIATEANALAQATGGRKLLTSAARDFTAALIDRLKVRNIRPGQYTSAESRAAKAADKASQAGDLATAAAEKRNQLIQNYAARAAYRGQAEVDQLVRYLRKFERDGTRQKLDPDYLDQIDALLERFDLRKGQSLKAIDKRTSLARWMEERGKEGTEPDIPDWLAAEANREHYKNLTLEQLRGLADSVKQIEHLGRLKHKLLTAADQRALDAIVAEVRASITEHAGGRVIDNERRNTVASTVAMARRGFMAAHRKLANLVREMDGFRDGGPLWEYLVRPMNDAGNREASMRADASRRLNELVKPVLAGGPMGGKGVYFPSLGRSLNRGERLALALNWGNAGNRQRLLDGRSWTAEQVQPALATLTATDWTFVQQVWDFFESYRPEIAAKERRVMGKEPDWVEPTPLTVQSADGQMVELRGGYYPIKYDPRQSGEADAHNDAEQAKAMMRAAYTAATTRRSFTKSRAEAVQGRPLLLSFDGLYSGANEVIHDLAWHEWLIDANKLMRRLDSAMRSGYGAETVTAIKRTIEDIARGDQPATNAVETSLNHLRTGATVTGLGWNLTTAMLQPLGLFPSMARIGPVWVARGVREFYGTPSQMLAKADEVQEKSEFMRNRARTMSREINDVQNQLTKGKGDARRLLEASFFILIQKLQTSVDYPTWLGAYEKALADPSNHREDGTTDDARAIRIADQAVIDSQGEGQIKDLAQVQRGHPAFKLFTNFYSYFSAMLNLAVDSTKRTDFKDPVQVARLAGDYLLIAVVPSVMSAVLRAGMKGDDDDLAKKVGEEMIGFLMGLFVGVRELTAGAQLALGVGNPAFGYAGPAGARFFAEVTRLGQQVGQGELDAALAKAANNVLGLLFHYPAGAVNRAVEGSAALAEGRSTNPLAPLVGPPPK